MKLTKLLLAAGLALSFAASAQAQTLSATFDNASPQKTLKGTLNGSSSSNYSAGVMNFTDSDSNVFNGFCAEPSQTISNGDFVVYQITDPTTLTSYDSVARLVGGFLASSQTANDSAAVQWAIWEVIAETSNTKNLYSGSVKLSDSSTVGNLANSYLSNINSFTAAEITYLKAPNHQDIVSWNVVPEPSTAGLALFSGLLLFRRKRA